MLKFFGKKKEAPATITLADHEAALALMAKANVDLEADLRANHASAMAVARTQFEQEVGVERDTVARLVAANRALKEENATLRAEAEANKVDAEAHRERLRRDREYHQRRRQRVAA